MMHTTMKAMAITGVMALTLWGGLGCKTAESTVDKTTEVAANLLLPPSEENKLGEQFSAEAERELKLHPDPAVQDYVKKLGAEIAAAAKGRTPDEISFTFKVVDDPDTVNAFAMPGGYIYVYSGLLLRAENEAEVIGVLGHEVAHVTERHVAERLVAAYGLQALTSMALGKNSGQVSQIVAGAVTQGYLLKYGREQESESDRIGLSYVLNAGYDPQGMVSFFEKLNEASGGARQPTFLSSHPHPADRVKALQTLIRRQGTVPQKTGVADFKQIYPQFSVASSPQAPSADSASAQ